MADILAIEHPTIKVPYEILNKKFRTTQKVIDREISHLQTSMNELERGTSQSPNVEVSEGEEVPRPETIESIAELLTGVIDKLQVLKRKANDGMADELQAANTCKRRLDHVKEYCMNLQSLQNLPTGPKAEPSINGGLSSSSSSSTVSTPLSQSSSSAPVTSHAQIAINSWKKVRLDRMLVEHFLRIGCYGTAMKLAKDSGIEHLTNIDLFLVSRDVEESLKRRETDACLNWCYENKSKLKKVFTFFTLEFNLRQQEFIEMVRKNQLLEGVTHVRKYLSTTALSHQKELQNVMGLLAFSPDTNREPYKSLFSEDRWHLLIDQFRLANYKLFQLSTMSVFTVTLEAGLSALKTPHCYRKNSLKVADCPVCSDLMNVLAKPLPCAHCSQSKLVCNMSGMPLNENNPPMMLPNGYVYGSIALTQMANDNKGRITCPRTKKQYNIQDAVKVYVM